MSRPLRRWRVIIPSQMFSLIRHSLRSWKNAKGLALLAVVALAVGIGCATAIFTVVDVVLLKPLPYSHGDRWVALFGGSTVGSERDRISALSMGDLQEYQARTRSFDVFGWYTIGGDFNLTSPGQPQHIDGIEVTSSLIDNVGVQPVRGRLFKDSDGVNAAVLASRLWNSLGTDPEIVGRTVTLDGKSYTVVGVMPPWFRLPIVSVSNQDPRNDVWIPVNPPRDEGQRRGYEIYAGYARLKPGVSLEQARADAKRVASEIAKESPGNHQSYTAYLFSLREFVVRGIRPILLLLFGAAGLLLLITCANVAGLLVARSVGRARETAIRVALGGGRGQLALHFFSEGLLIAILAAALGVAASIALVRLVVSLATEYIPRADEVSVNWMVMLFALGMACVVAILSALAPLWQALRTQPNEVLSEGVRASAGARSRRLSKWLVIAEIALAFTLVSAGALLVSQLENLNRMSPGFDPDHLLTFQLNRSEARRPGVQGAAAQERLLQAFEAIPGVSSVAVANQLPLVGCCFQTTVFPEGQPSDPVRSVSLMIVSAGYFKTMQIPLRKGRLLNEHDTNQNIIPVVIDESAARRYWRNADPIGVFGRAGGTDGSRFQVVGVVGDVRNEGLGEASRPELYVLNALAPPNPMQVVVRSNLPTAALVPAIRRALRTIDPSQPIYAVRTMREVIGGSLTFQRLDSIVITFFALAALLMASLGVYSVTSFSVRQRTVEMGTRMALGAIGRDLVRLIVGSGLRMAVYGITIGAVAVVLVTLVVVRFFNVHDISPVPYLYSIATITGLAMFASFFPAWRATLLSPMVAIRNESDSIWATTRRGLKQVLSLVPGAESENVFDSTLLTEFIEASRRSGSFPEVLRATIATVRNKIQAQSVMLLEQISGEDYRCIAANPELDPPGLSIPKDGFLLNRVRFYSAPLAFTAGDLETSLRWALEQKPQHLAEIESLKQSGVRLAVALRAKNEILGILLLGAPMGRNEYSSPDKSLLRAWAGQFALMIENARLTSRVLEQEKLRRDVALAAEVQKRLLPENSPQTATTSLAAFTLAARTVGGDYYDFFDMGDHRIGIALADVAGKGVAAALIMAVIHSSLRIIASEGNIPLPELAAKMNSFLHRSTGVNSYATFFYAQIDEENRRLQYVNAGHNPPYLIRASDAVIEELATGGMIIGMFPIARYEEAAVDLRPGDVMLAFTDGVTEALSPGEEEFGEERLKNLLRRVANLSVDQIASRISDELRRWIAQAPQHDDLTFIVMKLN